MKKVSGDINSRFKELRQYLNLSQQELGELLGISKSGVSEIENNRRNVTEQHIKMLLASEHSVSEEWIRFGVGNIIVTPSRNEAITKWVSNITKGNLNNEFIQRFAYMLTQLNQEDWKVLDKMVAILIEAKEKTDQ